MPNLRNITEVEEVSTLNGDEKVLLNVNGEAKQVRSDLIKPDIKAFPVVEEINEGDKVLLNVNGVQKQADASLIKPKNLVGKMNDNGGETFNDYSQDRGLGKNSHAEGIGYISEYSNVKISNIKAYDQSYEISVDIGKEVFPNIIQFYQNKELKFESITKDYEIIKDAVPDGPFQIYKTVTSYNDISSLAPGTYDIKLLSGVAMGDRSHVEGNNSIANARESHAEGWNTMTTEEIDGDGKKIGDGVASHAEGRETRAIGRASHAEGRMTKAIGAHSHAEGGPFFVAGMMEAPAPVASGDASHAEGIGTATSGKASHAEGIGTTASGEASHAEGFETTASDYESHAEGFETTASGEASHAEGMSTIASGDASHAEGYNTTASGEDSHAEGSSTTASRTASHAEGGYTTASDYGSHAEGSYTTASGNSSHAEGSSTTASGNNSHAEGGHTTASGVDQHVQGKYNIDDPTGKYAHIVGNGSYLANSNAHTLDWKGNSWYAGAILLGETTMIEEIENFEKSGVVIVPNMGMFFKTAPGMFGISENAVLIKSSTPGSGKYFQISVDDTGIVKTTDVTSTVVPPDPDPGPRKNEPNSQEANSDSPA